MQIELSNRTELLNLITFLACCSCSVLRVSFSEWSSHLDRLHSLPLDLHWCTVRCTLLHITVVLFSTTLTTLNWSGWLHMVANFVTYWSNLENCKEISPTGLGYYCNVGATCLTNPSPCTTAVLIIWWQICNPYFWGHRLANLLSHGAIFVGQIVLNSPIVLTLTILVWQPRARWIYLCICVFFCFCICVFV